MSEAIFVPDGELLVPTEHARGPWAPNEMHGGAPAALVARALERLETPVPMRVARLAFAFLGAVPMVPVAVDVEIARPGRRLMFAQATVLADGKPALRAAATLMRIDEVPLPEAPSEEPPPGPEHGHPASWRGHGEETGFHLTGMEIRFVRGDWLEGGPALAWFRLRRPLVEGEDPTPLQRAAAASDFGNDISRTLDFSTHLFVNTDLTLHLHREPAGEWVALDARTDLDGTGMGQATSVLHDERGRIGTAAQSLFVDVRR